MKYIIYIIYIYNIKYNVNQIIYNNIIQNIQYIIYNIKYIISNI